MFFMNILPPLLKIGEKFRTLYFHLLRGRVFVRCNSKHISLYFMDPVWSALDNFSARVICGKVE